MADLLNKIKIVFEDGLDTFKANASNIKEITEDFGKTTKLRFELYQLQNAKKKKLELLGETVYPFLIKNDYKGLKAHETLQVLLDEIKNYGNEIELIRRKLDDFAQENRNQSPASLRASLQTQIDELENDIEDKIKELKTIKENINNTDNSKKETNKEEK
jgi:predicted RNase H-like nuclease (RuvC/YqgF family)